jgi:hypothetical protein
MSPKIIHLTIFIHLNPFSSTFMAFIQHPDELASGYVLVVPPGRKTKNHRKNTAQEAASSTTGSSPCISQYQCFFSWLPKAGETCLLSW